MKNVAIIIFNRPEATRRLLALLQRQPLDNLFVIGDAPRVDKPQEAALVTACREAVVQSVFPCPVHTNYASENMGCRERVSSGLDWLFRHVEDAIILEDDCLPDPSFFSYCEELLQRYRCDSRVMSICGTRLTPITAKTATVDDASYGFSRYHICWGWATWRRAWQLYDADLSGWPVAVQNRLLHSLPTGWRAACYWRIMLQRTRVGKIDSWAYRWMFSHWLHSGLAIVPQRNLVTNIGDCANATHTPNDYPFLNLDSYPLRLPLQHPKDIHCDYRLDKWIEDHFYSKSFGCRLRWFIRRLLKRFKT